MLTPKDRDWRSASIRKHVLLYAKRNDVSELDKALAELRILRDLAAPAVTRFTHEDIDYWLPNLGGRLDALTARVADLEGEEKQ